MKIILPISLAMTLLAMVADAQTKPTATHEPDGSSRYEVVEHGPHHRVWSTVTWSNDERGKAIAQTNSYVELATGLNFFNEKGEWEESKEEIEILPNGKGAAASKGQHKVFFPPDVYDGQIEMNQPDGKWLVSRVLGLSYFDTASGQNVLIAEITNSVGEVQGNNVVIYPNAFTDFQADLRYTYTREGFEQDVVLRGVPPLPEEFGLNPETTRLQVLTEFFNPPTPAKESKMISSKSGGDVADENLDFGAMQMVAGKAFSQELEGGEDIVPVSKQWLKMDGRDFLIEEVQVKDILPSLNKLPRPDGAELLRNSGSIKRTASIQRHLPLRPRLAGKPGNKIIKQAKLSRSSPSFVLDYITVNTSLTNYVFQSDTTYYLSGNVTLNGTNSTFEGGTILKYTNNVSLTVNTWVTWLGDSYRPVILTSKDDNTVGETIAGSTGSPGNTFYAANALYFNAAVANTNLVIQNLRVANATRAIAINTKSGHVLQNVQLVKCAFGLALTNAEVNLRNALMDTVRTNFTGSSSTGRVEHLTSHKATRINANIGSNLFITNSLLVLATNATAFTSVNNRTNSAATGIFQIVGAGSHYLVAGSTNRNVGTTNINAGLLAGLRKLTTFAPIVYSNLTFSVATNLNPQAQRDTSTNDLPDVGYHYDPIDYAFSGVTVTNATLTLTNGVAIAGFNGSLIKANNGSTIISQGRADNMNRVTLYSMVQEQPIVWGAGVTNVFQRVNTSAPHPVMQLRFTDFSFALTNAGNVCDFYYNPAMPLAELSFGDSWLRGVYLSLNQKSNVNALVTLTNNLIERGYFSVVRDDASTLSTTLRMRNNLFYKGKVFLTYNITPFVAGTYSNWVAYENVFHNANVVTNGNVVTNILSGYNGYLTGDTQLNGSFNVVASSFTYTNGPLGNYYQQTTSFANGGSRTADAAGLYHHTTTANQSKETNSVVDLGYHYVAVNTSGQPVDSDADGSPDYLEDANGNGVIDDVSSWLSIAFNNNSQANLTASSSSGAFTSTNTTTLFSGYAVVGIGMWSASSALVTNVTYGGTPMTLLAHAHTNDTGEARSYLWGLPVGGLASGNYNVSISFDNNSSHEVVASARLYEWVNQSSPVSSSATAQQISLNPSVNLVSATNELMVDCVTWHKNDAVAGAGQTQRWKIVDGTPSQDGAGSDKIGAVAGTMSWTLSTNHAWALAAVSLKPLAGLTTNQPPVVQFNPTTLNYTENDAGTVLSASSTVTDADSANFDTGVLTIDYSANGQAEDRLAIRNQGTGVGQIGISGANITYGGTTIGTFSGGSGTTPLVVTFNTSSSVAAAQALMRNLTYTNISETPSTLARTVRAVLTDGDGGTSSATTMTINVSPVNDAPGVYISFPANNAVFVVGQTFTNVAVATDLDGTITNVHFLNGTNLIGFAAQSVNVTNWTLAWTNAPLGTNSLKAVAMDGGGLRATSAPIVVIIASIPQVQIINPAAGKLLVVGGSGDAGLHDSSELYNLLTGTWTTSGSLSNAHSAHKATLLHNGKVLVVGGNEFGEPPNAELYNPATQTWTETGDPIVGREFHTATLLPNGKVLVAGGYDSSAELYDPPTGTWTLTGSMSVSRSFHTATLLPNGKVLVTGGGESSAELYDPTTGTWTNTGSMSVAQGYFTSTLLPNGKVLAVGGDTVGNIVSIYDPSTGTWVETNSLANARGGHTATLLGNGKVLVVGGFDGSVVLASAELFDPATGTWTSAGNLSEPRSLHQASLLPDGNVLVTGGGDPVISSVEIYNTQTGIWSVTNSLAIERVWHQDVWLPSVSAPLYQGASMTITGLVVNAVGNITNFEFFVNSTLLGNRTTPPYTNLWTNIPRGTNYVSGRAFSDLGQVGYSWTNVVFVEGPPIVTIVNPTNGFNALALDRITIDATAISPNYTIQWVQFFVSTNSSYSNSLGFALSPNTNGFYQVDWTPLYGGTYTLTARALDSRGSNALSAPVTVTVRSRPSVTITNPINNSVKGPAPFDVSISANATAFGATITNVSYYVKNGTNLIGASTTAPSYTISWNSVSNGTYLIGAKATDSQGASAYSIPVEITVRPPNIGPNVNAGLDTVVRVGETNLLVGVVSDDGLTSNFLAAAWSRISGPGTVTFGNTNQPSTTVFFSQIGTNILQLKATDGVVTNSDMLTAVVISLNQPPEISAGSNQMITLAARYSVTNSNVITKSQQNVKSSRGKEFWLGFPDNHGTPSLRLFISSETNTSGSVSVPSLSFYTNFTTSLGGVSIIDLPPISEVSVSGQIENKGIHITSQQDISVYALTQVYQTTDAYLGLPVNAIGTNYTVLGWKNSAESSQLLIVGTEKNTTITITTSADLDDNLNTKGSTFTIALNQGQTLQLKTLGGGIQDLSGTVIISDKPVAVFAGNACANIPENFGTCDTVVEQLPPVNTWGKLFFTVPLSNRYNGDTFQIVASLDDTIVSSNGIGIKTLAKSEVFEFMLTNACKISADKPILLAQYSNGRIWDGPANLYGDPFMMLIPPHEQYLTDYTYATITDDILDNFVNIVVTNTAINEIFSNGVALASTLFTNIADTGYAYAQLQVEPTSYRFSSDHPFGICVYGFGIANSYGYPGGMTLGAIADISAIAVSPVRATNELNTTCFFTVGVTNQNSQPLVGVRVDFQVSGANSLNWSVFTDEIGQAKLYYAGTNMGVDTIRAFVGTNNVLGTNIWDMPFFSLHGFVSDDGLPGGITNCAWTQRTGPLISGFSNSGVTNPVVHLNEEGIYVFRLTANDTELTSYDETLVTVRRNSAPSVDACTNIVTKNPIIPLIGSATDDGLPNGTLTTIWRKISGPGSVTFGNAAQAATTATCSSPGNYVFRLTASDSQAEVWDDLNVSILVDPQTVQCGDTISGNLASTDLRSMERLGSYADYYRFVGESNQILTITLTSTNLDTFLFVRNQQLKLLAECDDGIDSTNSQIVYVLPSDGEYLIEATSFGTNSTGSYSIEFKCGLAPIVRLISPLNGAVYTNVPATLTLTADAFDADGISSVKFYTNDVLLDVVYSSPYTTSWLDVGAGNYTITAVAYDSALPQNISTSAPVNIVVGLPTLILSPTTTCPRPRGQNETLTATLRNGAGDPIQGSNITFNVFGANVVTNTVATDSSGIASFTYLSINGGRDQISVSITISGQPITANIIERNWARQINCSQTFLGSLMSSDGNSSRVGYSDFFYFTGHSNENVHITLSSTNFDAYLKLYDNNCSLVAFNDDRQGSTDSDISTNLSATVDYLVEVTSSLPNHIGSYRLLLECDNAETVSQEIAVFSGGLEFDNYATLDFGTTNVGTNADLTLTITNSGTGDLMINSIGIAGDFTITSLPSVPIPAGGFSSFTVRFNASTNGAHAGTLTLVNNDGDNGDGVENPFFLNLIGVANIPGVAPTVYLTCPTNNATYFIDELISVGATATALTGIIAKVEFVITTPLGRFIIGRDTNSPFATDWIVADPGDYPLVAYATDSGGRITESTNIIVHILASTNTVSSGSSNHAPAAFLDGPIFLANSANNVFDPRANDTDPDSDPLTIISLGTNGMYGSARIVNNGTAISYTPEKGYASPPGMPGDGFSYTISDGRGGTSKATVLVYLEVSEIPEPWITYPPDDSYSTNAGQVMPITATITNTPNTVKVEFYRNGMLLGMVTNGSTGTSFTLNWIATSECDCPISAQATDKFDQVGTSPPRYIHINPPIGVSNTVATIDSAVSTLATNALSTGTTVTVREGVFDIYGRAYQVQNSNIVWTLGVYSTGGELLRELSPPGGATTHVGNSSSSNKLATCDLSGLENGVYEIRLAAISGYISANTSVKIRLDANLKIGQFGFSQQDLVIPVGGIPLTVIRTYNSMNPRLGDFGYSWTYAINGMDVELHEQREDVSNYQGNLGDDDVEFSPTFSLRQSGSRDVTLTLPDGQRTTFTHQQSGPPGTKLTTAQWVNLSPEVTATLEGYGDSRLFELYDWRYFASEIPPEAGVPLYWGAGGYNVPYDNYDFPGWMLKTLDDTRYIIEREDLGEHTEPNGDYFIHTWGKPKLTRIEQPNGNVIIIGSDSIRAYDSLELTNLVRQINFERNADGLITGITDPAGMDTNGVANGPLEVKYEYDSFKNLINVLQLVDRTNVVYVTNSFAYTNVHFPHYITSMIDARGITVARNEYDDEGRLTAVTDANGKVSRFFHSLSNRMEIITDRLGYTNTFVYDLRGNVTDTTNALGIVTRRGYNDANREVAVTNAFGTAQQTWSLHAYDKFGNQTNVVTSPDHTNSFAFDGNGVNLLWQRDPIGNVTTNGYDSKGNLTNTVQLDSLGNVLSQSSSGYNSKGQLKTTRNAAGQVTATFGYSTTTGDLTSTTDANGVTRSFGYDANGNQNGSSYVWTPPGGGSPVTVSSGSEYDAAGRVVRSVDALGNASRTFYNAGGKVSYTVDKFNNTNSFIYDARGNLIQSTSADGLTTKTVYDDAGRAYLTTDRNGITGTITYFDAGGRATNVVRLLNVVVNIESDTQYPALKKSVVGSLGTPISTNSTEYLPSGWVRSRTGADGQTTTYEYYADGQTKFVIDALNHTNFFKYDIAGRQEYVVDALQRTNRFGYDSLGRNVTMTFQNNSYTSNYFNTLGQRTVVRDQADLLTQFGYDVSGQLTNVTKPSVLDPVGGTNATPQWNYKYDQYGRLTVTTDPLNQSTTNVFDAYGREVTRLLPMGGAGTTNFYNALGQLTNQIDFKGQKRQTRYDRFGRVTNILYFDAGAGITHPSNTVHYYYNQLGQLTNITEKFGEDASSGYIAWNGSGSGILPDTGLGEKLLASLGRMPVQAQGGSLALVLCAFAFVCIPRERRRQFALSFVEAWRANMFSLSAGGEGRGEVVRSETQLRSLPSSIFHLPSSWGILLSTILHQLSTIITLGGYVPLPGGARGGFGSRRFRLPSYGWRFATIITLVALIGSDPAFNSLWNAQAACTIPSNASTLTTRITTFTYDVEGRLAQVNSPEGVINYDYDLITGRHVGTCTQNSETTYEYDALGRLWKVHAIKRNGATINETTTYEYTEVGSRKSVELPSTVGIKTDYAYDDLNRLTGLTNRATGGTILSQFNYQVDATGRRTNAVEIIKTEDVSTTYQTNTLTWQYDGMYRLTNEVCVSTVSGASYTNQFQYDLAGNRWQKTRKVGAATETVKSYYNANDQLLREEITPLSGSLNTNFYAYDANGSLTAKTNATSSTSTPTLYTYDLKNKLNSVTTVGSSVTNYFVYNESGVRVRTTPSSGSATLYLVDGNNLTGYAQVLEETTGSTLTSYVLGDDVLAQAIGSSTASYLLYDGHGSTRQVADNTGAVTSRYNYDAYGVTLGTSSATAQTDFLYCGEQYDSTLGMYNNRARFYNPSNGRFNARDTFGGSNSDPQSLHKYGYCHGDPVNGIDPSGNFTLVELMVSTCIAAIGAALLSPVLSKVYQKVGETIIPRQIYDSIVNGVGFPDAVLIGASLTASVGRFGVAASISGAAEALISPYTGNYAFYTTPGVGLGTGGTGYGFSLYMGVVWNCPDSDTYGDWPAWSVTFSGAAIPAKMRKALVQQLASNAIRTASSPPVLPASFPLSPDQLAQLENSKAQINIDSIDRIIQKLSLTIFWSQEGMHYWGFSFGYNIVGVGGRQGANLGLAYSSSIQQYPDGNVQFR